MGFLLALSIVLAVCKSSIYNAYAKGENPSAHSTFVFNAASYGFATVVALVALIFSERILSLPTLICAIMYAIVVVSLQTISITAMKSGAMTTTVICVMYGMIIPSVAGPIFWEERLGALQIVGICLMLGSLWLLNKQSSAGERISGRWMILAAIAFLLSGMAGLMEKIHQSTDGRGERVMFVFVACLFMTALSLVGTFVSRRAAEGGSLAKKIPLGAISGVVIGLYSTVNLTLSGGLDSMIYYPIANGGALLLTVIISRVVFKERLSLRRAVGVVIGLCGIICLSIPV